MPRSSTPRGPIIVCKETHYNKKYYFLISDNSYVYHHFDNKWRIRRVKNFFNYCYTSMRSANKDRAELNRIYNIF